MIVKLKIDGDQVVTGSKSGELKLMKFDLFKNDVKNAPSCISIKNWQIYIYIILYTFYILLFIIYNMFILLKFIRDIFE